MPRHDAESRVTPEPGMHPPGRQRQPDVEEDRLRTPPLHPAPGMTSPVALPPGVVLGMQRSIGNRAVQRLVGDGGGVVQRETRLSSEAEAIAAAESAAQAWQAAKFTPKPNNTGKQGSEYLPNYLAESSKDRWANRSSFHGYFRRASNSASSPSDIDLKLAPSADAAVPSDFNYHIKTKVEESPAAKALRQQAAAAKASAKSQKEIREAAHGEVLAAVSRLGKPPSAYKNKINWAKFEKDGGSTPQAIETWLKKEFPELVPRQPTKKAKK